MGKPPGSVSSVGRAGGAGAGGAAATAPGVRAHASAAAQARPGAERGGGGGGGERLSAPGAAGLSRPAPARPIVLDDDEDLDPAVEGQIGATMQLVGLQAVPELNGEIATVKRFDAAKGRFEVRLWKNGNTKALQPKNLEALSVVDEVSIWRDELTRSELGALEARQAVARLGSMDVTVDALQRTRIGKVMADMTKRIGDSEVASAGRELVKRWRELYQREQAHARGDVTGPSVPATSSSDMANGSAAVPPRSTRCQARVMVQGLQGRSAGQCSKVADKGGDLCDFHRGSGGLSHRRVDSSDVSRPPAAAAAAVGGGGGLRSSSVASPTDRRPPATASVPPSAASNLLRATQQQAAAQQPAAQAASNSASAARETPRSTASDAFDKVEPITSSEDALRIVNAMRNCKTDRQRLGLLNALDRSQRSLLPAFVTEGGLAVLDKWIRTAADIRFPTLAVLQKIPVFSHDLKQARIPSAVDIVARLDASQANRQKAIAVLEAWRAEGLIPPQAPSAVEGQKREAEPLALEGKQKRRRVEEVGSSDGSSGSDEEDQDDEAGEGGGETARREASQSSLEKEDVPPELDKVDPRIKEAIMQRPAILEFLSKHRSVLQNLNAETVMFLNRNLRNSKDTLEAGLQDEEADAEDRTIMIANLHPQATEDDVATLLEGSDIVAEEVTLPRESRRQRSCCVAYAVLSSREAAMEAVLELKNASLRGHVVDVQLADRNLSSPLRGPQPNGALSLDGGEKDKRRISWRNDEELWEVALFDRAESTEEFRQRIDNNVPCETAAPAAGASERFQAAAKREHADERERVREALGGNNS